MNDPLTPDTDPSDELSYEDFDDVVWADGDELESIDLDALDDDLTTDEGDSDVVSTLAQETAVLPNVAKKIQPESIPAVMATSATSTPPDIMPETYCALLPLPPDQGAKMLELRETGTITTMPPPGIILTVPFRTIDLLAVETTLAAWADAQLPFRLDITGVVAHVIGAQHYIAAWSLQPEEKLIEVQHALKHTLAPLMLSVPGSSSIFDPRIMIGDHINPNRYPHVIGQMQRDFESYTWHVTELQLARLAPDAEPGEWVIAQSFD